VALEPEETAEEPEPPVPAEPGPDDSRQITAAQAQTRDLSIEKETPPADNPTPSVLGKFQRNLIIVLAGISIVILALIGFLLMQKRNNAARNRPVESARELKTTADIMASIDARIKEKFKQYEQANPD
jgi:hypothetical protein